MENTEDNKDRFHKITKLRKGAKVVNYSSLYGVGAKKLSRNLGVSVQQAEQLLFAFWEMNKAVKIAAEEQYIKRLPDGTMWVKNPISGFYHNLRYEKDVWSTVNQSSGDYVFCLWTMFCRSMGLKISLNYHDEWLAAIDLQDKEAVANLAQKAMDKVNETLKLNKEIKMEAQFGGSYAAVH